jgi:hypothetical protein
LATGSALTFDGTNFIVGGGGGLARFNVSNNGSGGFEINPDGTASGPALTAYNRGSSAFLQMTCNALNHVWSNSSTEGMRLTSTGLGIGTSSPTQKLDVSGSGVVSARIASTSSNATLILSAPSSFYNYLQYSSAGSSGLIFYDTTNSANRMTLDSSGNLGLGVTPSAWGSGTKAFQVGSYGSVNTIGGIDVGMANNAYNDGTNWKYIASQEAAYLKVNRNTFLWNIAAAGSAGANITFTQAMTLDASSRLLVGTTTLGIAGNSNTALSLANGNAEIFQSIRASGGDELLLYAISGAVGVYSYSNTPLVFGTNNAERMRISSTGNVGIGTSSPSAKLDVNGQINTTNIVAGIRSNITSTDRISVTSATTIFSIATSGSSVGASSAFLLVNGYDTGTTTNSFTDLVQVHNSINPVSMRLLILISSSIWSCSLRSTI